MPHPLRPPSLLGHDTYAAAQIVKVAQRQMAPLLAEHDLCLPHFAVLAALGDLGPRSQQQLADGLDVDKSHIARFVGELDARGLLAREVDPEDRRRHRVTLTDEGAAVLGDLRPRVLAAQAHAVAALDAEERAQLAALLQRALDACDAERLGAAAEAAR